MSNTDCSNPQSPQTNSQPHSAETEASLDEPVPYWPTEEAAPGPTDDVGQQLWRAAGELAERSTEIRDSVRRGADLRTTARGLAAVATSAAESARAALAHLDTPGAAPRADVHDSEQSKAVVLVVDAALSRIPNRELRDRISEAEAYLVGVYQHTAELWEASGFLARGECSPADGRDMAATAAQQLLCCLRAAERELDQVDAGLRQGSPIRTLEGEG